MRIEPLGERVVVAPVERPDRTSGGLFIPDIARDAPQVGVLVAIGGGVEDASLEVGNKVLHGKFAGTEIHIGDEPHLVLRLEDLLGVVHDG